MKTIKQIQSSALGQKINVRFTRPVFDSLKKNFLKDRKNEQFAFGLFRQAKTADGTSLLVQDIFFPDDNDLSMQRRAGVAPTHDFQSLVYMIAQQRKLGILDIHTHPFSDVPRFSCIDESEATKNAEFICDKFPEPMTHAMIVFDSALCAHDAVIYDRSLNGYRKIDTIEILGRRIETRKTGEAKAAYIENDPRYNRQVMIPGWDQLNLSRLKVAVVGLGGNGSQIVESLVSIGVGTEGWIAGIDPDIIEASNLPRIPYAFPEHIGSPKATVAAQYAGRKNPAVRFYPFPCSVTEDVVVKRIAAASVIICAPDGDGVRKLCNDLSVRYMIPTIDLGCSIIADNNKLKAAGQVRIVLPGTNACLVCCGGFDPSAAAIELMDDQRAAVHTARGYVIGHRAVATPSVANLNAVTSQLGIAALLSLVHGEQFGDWDYAHYDQLTAKTFTAQSSALKSCVQCSREAFLGAGDKEKETEIALEPKWIHMDKQAEKTPASTPEPAVQKPVKLSKSGNTKKRRKTNGKRKSHKSNSKGAIS